MKTAVQELWRHLIGLVVSRNRQFNPAERLVLSAPGAADTLKPRSVLKSEIGESPIDFGPGRLVLTPLLQPGQTFGWTISRGRLQQSAGTMNNPKFLRVFGPTKYLERCFCCI